MQSESEHGRALALVITDLASSTALKTQHGDHAAEVLITRHRDHVARLCTETSGRVIDWAGDGCFLTFETSSAAVLFALRLQQVHATEADLPAVRVGVHMGDVTERAGPMGADGPPRVEGLAVDIAARVSSLAEPGQVLMSSAVYSSARQRLGVDALGEPILWRLHGGYELKGIDAPLEIGEAGLEGLSPMAAPQTGEKVAPATPPPPSTRRLGPTVSGKKLVFAIVVICILFSSLVIPISIQMTATSTSGDSEADTTINAIAVLPLDNLMNDTAQEYFVDAMTDALISELGKIESIRVISRTSAMRYKNTEKDLAQIAAELGVDAIVEGSVYRGGDEVRVTARLVDARTDEQLWTDSYTNTLENVLALQAKVALAIAKEVRGTLTSDQESRLSAHKAADPRAQDEYFRGTFLINQRSKENIEQAITHFQRAKEIDPDYALAYAGLAYAYNVLGGWDFAPPIDTFAKAKEEALQGIELDDTLAEIHASLAFVLEDYDWDWAGAEKEYRRAIELNPSYAIARMWYAIFHSKMGRPEEAHDEILRARNSDPLSLIVRAAEGLILYRARKYDESITQLLETIDLSPDFLPALKWISHSFARVGKPEEAILYAEKVVQLEGRDSTALGVLGAAYADVGREVEARALLDELLARQADAYVPPSEFIRLYMSLGEINHTFEWMEKAYVERSIFGQLTSLDPLWDPIREDPRFKEILARLNFPE